MRRPATPRRHDLRPAGPAAARGASGPGSRSPATPAGPAWVPACDGAALSVCLRRPPPWRRLHGWPTIPVPMCRMPRSSGTLDTAVAPPARLPARRPAV